MSEDRPREPAVGRGGLFLAVGVGLATLVGVIADNPAFVLAPVLLVIVFWVLLKVPIRWPATLIVFLMLALDVSSDHYGLWSTPLVKLGDFLQDVSGRSTGGIKVAGFEMAVVFLLGIWTIRRIIGSDIDRRGEPHVPMPNVLRDVLVVFLAAFGLSVVLSLAQGHGVPPWKARLILHFPFLLMFFLVAFPGPRSFKPIAVSVVVAAQIKALYCAYTIQVASVGYVGPRMEFATNHGDSILFAMAMFIIIVPLFERLSRATLLRAVLLLPLPIWGIFLNNRRIAWAMLMQGLFVIFLATPWNHRKRQITRFLLKAAPILLIYAAAGWTSKMPVFAPVQKLHSMVDSKDGSTYWRDVESWNIAVTMKSKSPFVGVGIGGEYTEYMFNDDISAGYPEYREWPHNTVLGQMLFTGVVGFIGIWIPNLLTMFFAARSYRRAQLAEHRVAALLCIAGEVCVASMAWGDTGAHFVQHKLAAAMSLALASKLAVATGAWPAPRRGVARRSPAGGAGAPSAPAAT